MSNKWVTVVRQLGGIGDFLMLSPVFRGLKEQGYRVQLISGPFAEGSLDIMARRNPFIDRIVNISQAEYTTELTKKWQINHTRHALPLEDHPAIKGRFIDLNNACLAYECRGGPIDKPRNRIWCEAAGVEPSSYFPIYETSTAEKTWARRCFQNNGWYDGRINVGLATQSADGMRSLCPEHATVLANEALRRGARPILFGMDPIEGLACAKRGKLEDAFALIEQLDVMIAVDSGCLHIAGTMKTPVVGLFGPTDPAMRMTEYYGSAIDARKLVKCAFCWYKHWCVHTAGVPQPLKKACLTTIPTNVVVEEAIRIARRK